jgi:hypothetical protein
MSGIHSTQIVTSRNHHKKNYVYHSLHGTTSEETQLAKRIKRAEKQGERYFDLRCGDLWVKRDDGVWCEWTQPGWYSVASVTGKDAKSE